MRPVPSAALPLYVSSSLSPVARLAGAVVANAVKDARRGDEGAVMWFEDARSNLNFWAAVLKVTPEDLVERADRALRRRDCSHHATAVWIRE